MLVDETDANWADVCFVEAPAEDEYANGPLGKGYLLAGAEIPAALMATVDGAMHQAAKALVQQITGGSLSIRATGVAGMRVAGAAARDMMVKAAAGTWQVPESDRVKEYGGASGIQSGGELRRVGQRRGKI